MAGRSKSDFIIVDENFKPENVKDTFLVYRSEIINALKKNLKDKNKVSSGELSQSIKVDIKTQGNIITFTLSMEDYWKFVDKGVDGRINKHGSPYKFKKKNVEKDAMLEFIALRGIKVDLSKRKKSVLRKLKSKTVKKGLKQISLEKKRNTLAFLLGRSISKKGIKPTNFYSSVVNKALKERLEKDISIALKKDVEVIFEEISESFK